MRTLINAFLITILTGAVSCSSNGEAPTADGTRATQPDERAQASYELELEGRTVVLELELNDTILSKSYRQYFATDSGLEELRGPAPLSNCLYRGEATWVDGARNDGSARSETQPPARAWSALNTCNGISGMVGIDGETWLIAPGSAKDEVLLSRLSEGVGAAATPTTIRPSSYSARKREGDVARQTQELTTPTKYLELVLVSDAARFEELGANAPSDSLQIANLTDAIFRNGTLSPSIAIVVTANVVIPGGTNPWPVPADANAGVLLPNFATWARTHLPPADGYSLLTQLDLLGNTVGLGYVGATCDPSFQDTVVQAPLGQSLAAAVLAHELGHNLNMPHDDGVCAGGPYVMSASLPVPPATTWSSCSAAALAGYLNLLGASSCLNNVPVPDLSPTCGDGTRDPGEACDCGSHDCAGVDPCCDGATCQLVVGAACSAIDGCCNACQLAPQGTVCEAATDCAPAAICTGSRSTCDPPAPLANGTQCNVATLPDGRCFQGDCQSRSAQCAKAYTGATTCAAGASSCTDLLCALPGLGGCYRFPAPEGWYVQVEDGASCGSGLQCYQDACVSPSTIPLCENGLSANACGGCSSLAVEPGDSCNSCGVAACLSPNEIACSVEDPSDCADPCDASPCAVGEVCASAGPETFSCTDLDECSSDNGGCDPGASCTNTEAGRICGELDLCHPAFLCPADAADCPATTAPDGASCSDQDVCTLVDVCMDGACVGEPVADPNCARCHDGKKNGDEVKRDCGGSCQLCNRSPCAADTDCVSGYCKLHKNQTKNPGGICKTPPEMTSLSLE